MSKVATSTGVRRPASSTRPSAASRQVSSSDPGFYKRLIVIVCCLLAVIAGGWLIWISPVLGVKEIRVEGNDVVANADVRSSADVPEGTPLANLDLEEIATRVSTLPAVASAEVSRSWPNAIVITVVERVPVAVVTVTGQTWVVDKTGTVYLPVSSLPGGKAPASAIPLKVKEPGPDDSATVAALTVLTSLPAKIRALVGTLEAPSASEVTLKLTDGRTVIWGGSAESARKARLLGPLLSQPGSVFNVSTPNAVVIR